MKRWGIILLAAILLTTVALAGCGSGAKAPTKGDLLVFVAVPLSGFQANGGQTVLGGVRLAAAEIKYFEVLMVECGVIGWILWAMSILTLAIIVQYFITIRRDNILPPLVLDQVREYERLICKLILSVGFELSGQAERYQQVEWPGENSFLCRHVSQENVCELLFRFPIPDEPRGRIPLWIRVYQNRAAGQECRSLENRSGE